MEKYDYREAVKADIRECSVWIALRAMPPGRTLSAAGRRKKTSVITSIYSRMHKGFLTFVPA